MTLSRYASIWQPQIRAPMKIGWDTHARISRSLIKRAILRITVFAVRCLQRTSDCYEVNRVSVVPRNAVVVGSLKHSAEGERRYGRDALNNPSGGRVVAKANEADCIAQTPKSKHVRKGEVAFKVLNVHFCRGRTYTHSKFLLVRFQ